MGGLSLPIRAPKVEVAPAPRPPGHSGLRWRPGLGGST